MYTLLYHPVLNIIKRTIISQKLFKLLIIVYLPTIVTAVQGHVLVSDLWPIIKCAQFRI